MNIKNLVVLGSGILEEGTFDETVRRKYLNASEAMGCIRKQWYSKHQPAAAEPQEWGYARRGNHGEKFLGESLIAANAPLAYAGKDQETWRDEARKISATPDGILQYDKEWVVTEFKTIDPRTNKSKLPKAQHVAQLEIGMELIDQNIDRPDGVTLRGVLVYMDASNYFDIEEVPVARNKAILNQMAKRASKIFRTKYVGNLDREGKRAGGKECKTMCPFTRVCGVDIETSGTRRANRGSNMDASAIRYMAIKDQVDVLKDEQDGIKEDIKNEMKSRNMKKGLVGNIECSLTISAGRASLDKKAVKAAGIDLSPFETIGASSERLTVKRA